MSNSEIGMLIDQYIHNADYRMIMRRKLIDGATYERIAEETGRSARGVQEIVKRCRKQLNKLAKDVPV